MRTNTGTTAAGIGATYIPINRYVDSTSIQLTVSGTVTFTVDYTLDNIRPGAAASAVNAPGNGVAAASATWETLVSSGSVGTVASLDVPVDSLRINITAGTGTVSWRIIQEY